MSSQGSAESMACISKYSRCFMWDAITNLFPNIDGDEVMARTSDYFPLIYVTVFIHPFPNSDSGLVNLCQ